MDINSYNPKGSLDATAITCTAHLTDLDIYEILHTARILETKVKYRERITNKLGSNVLLISKQSTDASRIAFEIATSSLGAKPIILSLRGSHLETMLESDNSLAVIARYGLSSIVVDTSFAQDAELVFAKMKTPVFNANNKQSPLVSLSALLTVWKKLGRLSGVKVTAVGELSKQNAETVLAFAKCGASISIVTSTEPCKEVIEIIDQYDKPVITSDIATGILGANVIIPLSSNAETEFGLTQEVIEKRAPNAYVLANDLSFENNENASLLNGARSLILDQGENGLHVMRAATYLL